MYRRIEEREKFQTLENNAEVAASSFCLYYLPYVLLLPNVSGKVCMESKGKKAKKRKNSDPKNVLKLHLVTSSLSPH